MAILKSIEKFEQAKVEFNAKIAKIENTVAEQAAAIAKMEIDHAEVITAGDVAQAVAIDAQIAAKKAGLVTLRAALDKVTASKAKSFANVLEDARIEADNIRIDGANKYAAQEAKVLKAQEVLLTELKALGGIHKVVADANEQYRTVAKEVENMKPKGERIDLHNKLRLKFEQRPLFGYADPYRPHETRTDGICLTEATQEATYAGALKGGM